MVDAPLLRTRREVVALRLDVALVFLDHAAGARNAALIDGAKCVLASLETLTANADRNRAGIARGALCVGFTGRLAVIAAASARHNELERRVGFDLERRLA